MVKLEFKAGVFDCKATDWEMGLMGMKFARPSLPPILHPLDLPLGPKHKVLHQIACPGQRFHFGLASLSYHQSQPPEQAPRNPFTPGAND